MWVHASQPDSVDKYAGLTQDDINKRKSKTWWFERYLKDVLIKDIKPNRSTARANETAQVMDVIFDPRRRNGIYNPYPDPTEADQNRWGGLMQFNQGLNVAAMNTEFIEFWVLPESLGGNPDPYMYFEMGRISEDIIPNGILNTEDKNNNGRYDPGEDIGLDTLSNDDEKNDFPGAFDNNDPSNDNYSYDATNDRDNYDNLNGTEGNKNDPAGGGLRPDTEDLDGNSVLNLDNSYYQYKIPLRADNNPYIIGSSPKGWLQFRIPLSAYTKTVGSVDRSFANIEYFRLWFTDYTEQLHLRFHEITLTGSQWSRLRRRDIINAPADSSGFEINYVNIEDNAGEPTFYTPPPGAERDRLAGQSTLVLGNEQSLNLSVKCLPSGEGRYAVRIFPSPNDLFNYRSMAVWVHGDDTQPESVSTLADTANKLWAVMRFGSDEYNYYEYRRPLLKGWQNMHVDFTKLSSLKTAKANSTDEISQAADDGVPGSLYRVVGSPTVTNAPYFVLGLENHSSDNCVKTDVWFDELRLLEGNDKADYAMNGMVMTKLAEFGTVTSSFVNERADFHRVDERFNPMRARNFGWGVTGEFQMQKILPSWLERGTTFPLVVSHSESIITPKYLPNTDVEIESAVLKIRERADAGLIDQTQANRIIDSIRVTNESLTVRNSIAATGVKFTFPGTFFLLPYFVNQLRYGFGFGEEFNRTYQFEYNRSWSWTGSILYDLNNIPKLNVSPLKWIPSETFSIGRYSNYTINFLPNKFSTALSLTRGRKHSLYRLSTLQFAPFSTYEDSALVLASRQPIINRVFSATRGAQFTWKLSENGLLSPQVEYNLEVTSNLAHLETIAKPNEDGNYYDSMYFYQRNFSDIFSDIFFTNGALARLGNDYLSQQRVKITTNPRLPWLFWIDKYIRPIFSYTVDYRWSDAQTPAQNAKTGSWSNVISTGVELNLRPLGIDLFGSGAPSTPSAGRPGSAVNAPTPRGDEDFGTLEDQRLPGRSRVRRIGDVPGQSTTFIDSLRDKLAVSSAPAQPSIQEPKKPRIGAGGEKGDYAVSDTLLVPIAPPKESVPAIAEEPGITVDDVLRAVVQKPFFDWNGTRFNFTQTNYSLNGALQGSGSGITNFFAGGIFHPEWDNNGPSRAYQMGLITDPHGRLLIKFKNAFPFIGFDVRHGDRASSLVGRSVDITDVFTQKNTFELSTSRPLWTGAQISFNWKTEFTYDRRQNLHVDPDGKLSLITETKVGDVGRTFFSIPSLPFLDVTQSGLERVAEKWEEKTAAYGALTPASRDSLPQDIRNRLQVESFMEGFETLPLFSGKLREYLPRLNYTFSWSGLEKLPFFSFADRVSLRNGYNGTYKRVYRLDQNNPIQLTTLQTISYGFRPLIALDMGWEKIWNGRMTATLNYDTQTEWGADYSSNRITKRLSTTFGINANYQREGLDIPFFGLSLKNTFGATLLVSQTISSDIFYQFATLRTNPNGTGNGGLTKLTIEPRFSYNFSRQLTIEGFFRYERTIPASAGLLIPPTRLILAGFDIRLKIF
jgi:hypothetical protein